MFYHRTFTLWDSAILVMNLLCVDSILVFVVASYIAQRLLPPPKPSIIGIDLGTTFSCAAAYHPQSGSIEVILGPYNNTLTPSTVFFHPNGSVFVGDDAKALANIYPKNVIFEAKRFIGRRFSIDETLHVSLASIVL